MPTSAHTSVHPSHLRGLTEVAAASVLWGTGGLAVQLIREQAPLSAVTISAWRMVLAALALLVALVVLRRVGDLVALARARPRQLLAVGIGTAAYQGFYFVSVTQVGVAVATVVSLGLAPVPGSSSPSASGPPPTKASTSSP